MVVSDCIIDLQNLAETLQALKPSSRREHGKETEPAVSTAPYAVAAAVFDRYVGLQFKGSLTAGIKEFRQGSFKAFSRV